MAEEFQPQPTTSDSPGVGALKRFFQRTWKKLTTGLPNVKECENKSRKEAASLSNLLEQRDSVVTANNPLLDVMGEELRSKLMVELSHEITESIDRLTEQLVPMKELYDLTNKSRKEAVQLCRQYHHDLGEEVLSQGWPTIPPLSVMLAWLVTLNSQLKEQYFSRTHFLKSLNDPKVARNVASLWQSDAEKLNSTLQDVQEQTRYFLKEKL